MQDSLTGKCFCCITESLAGIERKMSNTRNDQNAWGAKMFPPETIYIVGNAKTQQHNPITIQYGQFFISFVVQKESGEIIDCGSSATIPVTNEFIRSLFVGKFLTIAVENVQTELENRYYGSSQRAILTAFKDAQKKYRSIVAGQKISLEDL